MVFIVQYKYKKDKRVLIVNYADETKSIWWNYVLYKPFFYFFPNISWKYTILQH